MARGGRINQPATVGDESVDSDAYVDGSIDTAHIAADQVTLAKMAGLARGKVIYGDASGDPAALAVGTAGYVLATDATDLAYTNSLLAADYIIGEDAGTKIDFETGDEIHFDAAAAERVKIDSTGLVMSSGSITINPATADETSSGIVGSFTAGEDLVRGEVVYFKAGDSKMWKAVATATGTMPVVAMCAADVSADAAGLFLLQGFLQDNGSFPAMTVAGRLYAPEAETSSQNVPEQTAPDSDGDFIQDIGWAFTANTVFFNPSGTVIEHA